MKKLFYASLLGVLMQGQAFAYDYTYEEGYGDHHKQFYLGGNIGLAAGDVRDFCDDKDINGCTPWKALLGYRINETFAVEGSYHQLINGRADDDYGDYDTSALSLSVLAFMPLKGKIEALDRMELKDVKAFGRFGLAAWETETDLNVDDDGNVVFEPIRGQVNSGTDFLLGGGVEMSLNDNFDVRGEVEYFGGDLNSTAFTAGVTYSTF